MFRIVEENGALVLAAIMTPPHRLILAAGDVPASEDALRQLAEVLFRVGQRPPGVMGPVALAEKFAADWKAISGFPKEVAEQLFLYQLEAVAIPTPDRGKLRVATEEDFELVARWWTAAHLDMFGKADPVEDRKGAKDRISDGDVFLWEDGGPVSMACKTRPTKHGITVGLVYTPPEARCRGYATACVGELSRRLLGSGWDFCSLFADVLNPISNSIYQKIGYRPIGNFTEYKFMYKEEKPPV